MNPLFPVFIAVGLNAGYLLLFFIALLMRCFRDFRKASEVLLRFLARAGLILLALAVVTLIPACIRNGNAYPLIGTVPTLLLIGIVAGTYREVRSPTADPRPKDPPKRHRTPEDR